MNVVPTFIFDVEGTLIDCVPQILQSWQRTLAEFGPPVSYDQLQEYSGMDGADMLNQVAPLLTEKEKQQAITRQGELYEREYLRAVQPFPGVRQLFATLKDRSCRIAIATTCKKEELAVYDERMRILQLTDAVECGDDVRRGKPHPDLFQAVIKRLQLRNPAQAWVVGDTPFDALAAQALHLRAIGLVTGGFSREHLLVAGCELIFEDVVGLLSMDRRPSPHFTRNDKSVGIP